MRSLLLSISLLFSILAQSQNYNMSNSPITDCSGTFNDSGGAANNYGPNQNFTTTLCSDGSVGTHVSLTFSNVQLNGTDDLCFYDGTSTADPQLACVSDFTPGASFIVQATAGNPSGCLTITFNSDGSGQAAGWSAPITCVPSCQTIQSVISASTPLIEPADTGWMDICPGQRIYLTGTGLYPQSGLFYNQSDANCDFEWKYGDGDISYGPNASHVYAEPGGYIIQLTITDTFGCTNTNFISQRVRVSTYPDFNLGQIPDEICAGDTISLHAIVNDTSGLYEVSVVPVEGSFNVQGIRSDSLALPDGTGAAYETSIQFGEFSPGQVLSNIADLESICVNIEHSWMRDLEISLTCPNGTTVILHNHPGPIGGQVFLGEPYEADEGLPVPIPGVGYDYCWTPTATNGTWIQYANANNPGTLPEGDYSSFQNLTNFLGCPLNGEWTISVEDLWGIDNGFIFSWSINFNPLIYPDIETFTPQFVDFGWVDNPTVIFNNQIDSIIASPINAGTANYVFSVSNDFGCTFDTAVQITVLPPTHPDCHTCEGSLSALMDTVMCGSNSVTLDATYSGISNQPITFESYPNERFGNITNPSNFPLESGLDVNSINPGTITNAAAQIISVCVDLECEFDSDLQIRLESPSGQVMELSTGNGGSGDDYHGTCFTPTAVTPITAGTAPFTGNFIPEGSWAALNGSTINGEWKLLVADAFGPTKFDTLTHWSITFTTQNNLTYSWSPAATLSCNNCPTPIATPVTTTTYTVQTNDIYGCMLTESATVTLLNILPAPTLVCAGASNGSLTITWSAIPGVTQYEVSIDGINWVPVNGVLSHTVSGLSPGEQVDFQVQAVAASGCGSETGSISCLYQGCTVYLELTDTIQVSCFGANDGQIYISAFNGQTPFTYTIDGGSPTSNTVFANLPAGIHTVIGTDAVGCTDTLIQELVQPAEILLTLTPDSVSCYNGTDGSVSLAVTGGVGGYDFNWNTIPNSSFQNITNISAGNYNVTVTDLNNCVKTASVVVSQPSQIVTAIQTDSVNCFNGNDGSATVTPTGGNAPYSYSWTGGQVTPTAVDLVVGTYIVTVTDDNSCTVTSTAQVLQPEALSLSLSGTNALCNGGASGTATVLPEGGTSPYSYLWNNNNQSSSTATNLPAGIYTVTVSDAYGCTETGATTISQPLALMLVTSTTPALCANSFDGTATVNVAGGTIPYFYNWDNAQINNPAFGLNGGQHMVIVTDVLGCSDTAFATVDAPPAITVNATPTDALCFGTATGSASVIAFGGTGTLSYSWSNIQVGDQVTNLLPGNYFVTATDINGCLGIDTITINSPDELVIDSIATIPTNCFGSNEGQAFVYVNGGTGGYSFTWDDPLLQISNPATNLNANNYMVTVTDNNGCMALGFTAISEPTPLSLLLTSTNALCFGSSDGSGSVAVSGGTPGYTYIWTNNDPDNQAENLPQGNFGVTVTDMNGCFETGFVSITQPATPVSASATQTVIGCYGLNQSQAQVIAAGGVGSYSYLWSNFQQTPVVNNLFSLDYYVTVTDGNGCESIDTLAIAQLDSIYALINFTTPSCFGENDGQAGVSLVSGGIGMGVITDYNYFWNVPSGPVDYFVSGLAGDETYGLTVTDAQGCSNSFEIFLDQPTEIQLSFATSNVSCFGYNDGSATVTATGDFDVFSYLWGPNANSQVTQIANSLYAGNYFVTVTDSTGCIATSNVQLLQPTALEITNVKITNNNCFGDELGEISLQADGGTPEYQFAWSNGVNADITSELGVGLYTITITDEKGCTITETYEISSPAPVLAELTPDPVTCYDGQDGIILVNASGGTPPYAYSLDGENYNGISNIVGLGAGEYDVYVRDGYGCTFFTSIEIIEPEAFVINAGDDFTISLGSSAQLTTTAINNQGAINYDWSESHDTTLTCLDCPNPVITPVYTTSYQVTAIDEMGCESMDYLTVFVYKERRVIVPTAFTPNDDTNNDILQVHGKAGTKVKLFQVFDRWGELVYQEGDFMVNDPIGWDGLFRGSPMDPGVFVWYAEVEYSDGEVASLKGNTTLIR